jgi:GNAT superfamily N-acetyltransferase
MILIRQASEADLEGVLRAYSKAGIDSEQPFNLEEARSHFQRFAAYPSYRLFVAVQDETVVGVYSLIILDNLAKRGRAAGVVESVAVLPERQGQGIGRAMMRHAMEECRKAGCYKLTLSSNLKREAAHRFYDSLGFERHGYSFLVEL